MGLFNKEKSLDELEEEETILKQKRNVLEEKVAIKALEDKLGKGSWKMFSGTGKKGGFSLERAKAWLKSH